MKAKIKAPRDFFLPYQKKWIEDRSRLKIMEKSRQVGMSWAAAYRLVREQSMRSTRLDAWVSSRDETQARLFLEDCRAFGHILTLAAIESGAETPGSTPQTKAGTITFAHGTRIHCLSSNADAQAGKRGTRLLDEFALHPDPRNLYNIAYPGITWGGQLEIISTHRGSDNYFNRLIQDVRHGGNAKNFSYHRVTLEDALAQGFLHKLQMKLPEDDPRQDMDEADYYNFIQTSCADKESFQQEYLCEPSQDDTAFLTYELITSCEYEEGEDWQREIRDFDPRPGAHDLYLGVDLGRTQDYSVFWLLEKVGDVLFTRSITALRDTPFSEQESILYAMLECPHLRRVCIDQSGLGRQFAERAAERFGRHRVEGLSFTAGLKESLAYPVREGFESRKIRIPEDRHLRADLRALRRERTAVGNLRFAAGRNENGHADRFWALALGIHAAGGVRPSPKSHYEPFARSRSERTQKTF